MRNKRCQSLESPAKSAVSNFDETALMSCFQTMVTLKAVVEALLFASQKPLSLKEIAAALASAGRIL